MEDHLAWPTHWFLITLGTHVLSWVAPAIVGAGLGAALVHMSTVLILLCLPFIFVAAVVDLLLRGGSHNPLEWLGELMGWALMPVIDLALTTLPAVDAHTRLLFGQGLGYQTTPKLARL